MLETIPQTIKAQEREQALKEAKKKEDEKEHLRLGLAELFKVIVMNIQLEPQLGTFDQQEANHIDDDPGISDGDTEDAIDDPRMFYYDYTGNRLFIKHRRFPKLHCHWDDTRPTKPS